MQKSNIGEKIKQFREMRMIAREELALNANLSVEQLRVIEEEGVVPSLGPLIRIARALGVRIGTFLDDADQVGPVMVRAGAEKSSVSFSSSDPSSRQHLNFFSLAADKTGRHMEPFIVDIEPAQASDYKLSSHEGEEFIYVMEGCVEINYGRETYRLEQGDSIYYDSIVLHNVHAGCSRPAKILAVVYTPY
ncbi:MAG: helix-turn-helix transcriptional regulator [Prolixibacteraceae bacterium]|jgi:transcriptional regulator with XRE-family HTH domain|nr:helix-turn-helix transcriptional regulator [Prolixibacteraceae bacterium]NLX28246.1 cupin domain-containing protein [Bacteroidales bacterium]HNQ37941.1 XRE family transcriptional regulator [Prolixibacteraceae bacterium]HOY50569.1 XRE family transcriptional regulator [Prolixibacteraceae bacterium]HPJ77538.1 XRE family transcriptional regulator [Prolixibacteraceae bacterium]